MKNTPNAHHNRRSIRLKNFNYASNGAYFITICTENRANLFGEIANGEMVMNDMGRLVEATWHDLSNHNPHVTLDAFVIMPNHIHGVIVFLPGASAKKTDSEQRDLGAGLEPPSGVWLFGAGSEPVPDSRPFCGIKLTRHSLPEIVRQLKTFSSRRINLLRKSPGVSVWQRNYYEHVIRSEADWSVIREYIINNPKKWDEDEENIQRKKILPSKYPWEPDTRKQEFKSFVSKSASMKAPALYLLFNHTLTDTQEKDARKTLGVKSIENLPENLKQLWANIPPELSDISGHLDPVAAWLRTVPEKNDFILIQGDFGACFIMVTVSLTLGLVPIYSTTQRIATEEIGSDGSIKLVHHFRHRIFRHYTCYAEWNQKYIFDRPV